jgi:predicted membrane protein
METFITTLTILNSVCIILIFYAIGKYRYYISIVSHSTFWNKTLYAYYITLWKRKVDGYSSIGIYTIKIPIRNENKVKLQEEIDRLMQEDAFTKRNRLKAKFSWIKTWEEARQFKKDYSVVDRKYVEELVSNFKSK